MPRPSPLVAFGLVATLAGCDDVACTPQTTGPLAATDTGRTSSVARPDTETVRGPGEPLPDTVGAASPSDSLPLGVPPPVVPSRRGDSATVASPRVPVPARVLTMRSPGSGLTIPVAGVHTWDIPDTFEDARSEGRVHNASDIMATRGTPVVAAAAGTVARLFTSKRGGLTVYVLSAVPAGPPGTQTVHYYAHLDAYAEGLAAGQAVAAGQVLGTVGETGNVSPGSPHLHYAIWFAPSAQRFWDGDNVNPAPLLWGQPTKPPRPSR